MPASGLLALLDDISTLLDDVALLTRVAAKKTAGVIGDDLALNAEQVTGMRADRELPVIWAVAKGALLNKAILVPVALLVSAWLPWAITPLLMVGGVFLCFEGFEKVFEKLVPGAHGEATHDGPGDRAARVQALADPAVDPVALEKTRVKGAIRTDFILSAEIVVIALGSVSSAPLSRQVAVLVAVGIGVTVLVYGLVALIVKVDDFGLRLQRAEGASEARRRVGAALLRGMPKVMKLVSVVGTVAMFTVGGSIVAHGIHPIAHLIENAVHPLERAVPAIGAVAQVCLDALLGLAVGGIVVAVVHLVRHGRSAPAAH